MPENFQDIVSRIASAYGTTSPAGVTPVAGKPTEPANPVLDELTSRLLKQTQGISTSASSEIQSTIQEAITNSVAAGEANRQRLMSERDREVAALRTSSEVGIYNTLSGGVGNGTLLAGLTELTRTTEKSIRDLNDRAQEAMLANDAKTLEAVNKLKMDKLTFLQQQEQNVYSNFFQAANLKEQALTRAQQNEQFWIKNDQEQKQFIMNLANSSYQFEKNYGIELQRIDLQKQQLVLEKERNAISRAEYALKVRQLDAEKNKTSLSAMIVSDLRKEVTSGKKTVDKLDPSAYALWAYENYNARGLNISFEEVLTQATQAVGMLKDQKLTADPVAEKTNSSWKGFFMQPIRNNPNNVPEVWS